MKQKVKYKSIHLPSIKELRRLVYKKAFDKLDYTEEKTLDMGLMHYPKVDLTVKEIDHLIDLNKIMIKMESGGFKEMKEKFKELNIDYKSVYGLN